MSFFGFDATLPRDRGHQQKAPGFGQSQDVFAGLSGGVSAAETDALDFDQAYDGLGDQLDETDDAFNDDTFGEGPISQDSVGKDFDFSGQTAMMATTLQEEQMIFAARQPPSREKEAAAFHKSKPAKTGYEGYAIPELQANASIWGVSTKKPAAEPQPQRSESQGPTSRKMMSLEEVEAAMLAQKQKPVPSPLAQVATLLPGQYQEHLPQAAASLHMSAPGPTQILQRPHPSQSSPAPRQPLQPELPGHAIPPPMHAGQHRQILQRNKPPTEPVAYRQSQGQSPHQQPPSQPRQILQNPNRAPGQGQHMPQAPHRSGDHSRMPVLAPTHNRTPSYNGPVVTHPEQLLQLSEEERAAYLLEDAKRAKRNHKIHLLSKDNGLMTPQDKNFITRIQLQQLVAATGGVDDQVPEAALIEDFYYQVYSQIRGAPRQTPHQPANQFAQTYLFQTGGRYGSGRRHHRGGDNHVQRMEQQVQRAVEAARAKPKNKQLVIEGSLGKISFSNAKTPKPLLNFKRADSADARPHTPGRVPHKTHHSASTDRKATLRDIENVYMTLMKLEDHERHMPPPINENSGTEAVQVHMEWQQGTQALNQQLWQQLRVMEPIMPGSTVPHPFIAILSHSKGKRAIPRIFRHVDEQQRILVLTMIVVHLDMLDVIQHGLPQEHGPLTLPRTIREEIELFANSVVPPLFALISEAALNIVIGLVELVLERTNIPLVTRTRTGLSLLTMFISRAELLKQSTPEINQAEWERWTDLYNRLFDAVEPLLPIIFPGTANDPEDVYVWQFLAAMGVGASQEQQQRLVIGVKDRVMETVAASKTLPADMSSVRLGHVNLFMRAIGLDVELLG